MNQPNLRVDLKDFWHDHSIATKNSSNLVNFLRQHIHITIDEDNPDVVFCSCFGNTHLEIPRNNGTLLVQFLGENVRPDLDHYDCSLSFDREEDAFKLRLPLYLLYDDWYDLVANTNTSIPDETARLDFQCRKFCGALISNPNAPERSTFVKMLMEQNLIESGGQWMINISENIAGEDSLAFRKQYQFFVAFENRAHPGYVTEKILGAMAAGCIPVYWGAPDVGLDFNEASFINCQHFKNFEEVIDRMIEISESPSLMSSIREQPWMLGHQIHTWGNEARSQMATQFVLSNLERVRASSTR